MAALLPGRAQNFEAKTLATGLRGGYQVLATDMNRDGKPDLLVLASGMTELFWLENPTWEQHVIARDLPRMINAAPHDLDKDGIPEIAVAWRFENQAKNSIGIVSLLQHQGDPLKPWKATEIDRLTTSHRLRWFNGLLINAPLTGAKAEPPGYNDRVPLAFYRPGEWKRRVIDDTLTGVMHGIFVERDSLLSASFEGIHRHKRAGKGWKREQLTNANASDVTTVKLGRKQVIAAIEPWHGNIVAVYDGKTRTLLDDKLVDGHTIVAADFDNDGQEEIVAGYRGGDRGVNLYRYSKSGWTRREIDRGGVAAAACIAVDLDGDKLVDIVCTGSATQNVRWYRQVR